MKYLFLVFTFTTSAFAAQYEGLRVVNLVQDDEGTKVVAVSDHNTKQPVVMYLSQDNAQYVNLSHVLQSAKTTQQPLKINTQKSELNLISTIETK